MTQWFVKELSKLTQVSVQTLHHYDRIDLLKPSIRLGNGYRVYSEKDLLKLQQIIALKFFGFELSQIKALLTKDVNVMDHFAIQSQFLEEKAKTLLEASHTLKNIIADCSRDKLIPWETIIKLIEVFRMTQQLEKTWAGKALSQDELQQYAHFEQEFKTNFSASDQKHIEQSWAELVKEINKHLKQDPTSHVGIELGKQFMDWVNNLYGNKYRSLRNALWEKGFKGGHLGQEHQFSPEAISWIDKAIDTYFGDRFKTALEQAISSSDKKASKQWDDLLTDIYGNDQSAKQELISSLLRDYKISEVAKNWLKIHQKSV